MQPFFGGVSKIAVELIKVTLALSFEDDPQSTCFLCVATETSGALLLESVAESDVVIGSDVLVVYIFWWFAVGLDFDGANY